MLSSASSMPFASEIVPPTLTLTLVACVLPMFDWLLLTVKVGALLSLVKLQATREPFPGYALSIMSAVTRYAPSFGNAAPVSLSPRWAAVCSRPA